MKNPFKALLNTDVPAATDVAAAKKALLLSGIKMALVLAVLIPATVAYITTAWFSANQRNQGGGGGITSQIVQGNLYIAEGNAVPDRNDPAYHNKEPIDVDLAGDLYPISTPDCINWYYVHRDASAWDTINHTSMLYDRVDAWQSEGVYSAANAAGEYKDFTAFNLATYVLYTDPNSALDIYINSTDRISVAAVGDTRRLVEALRIGLVVDENKNDAVDAGELKLVYAPVKENGVGNSNGATSGIVDGQPVYYYYCIDVVDSRPWLSDIDYAIADPESVGTYTPEGADGTGGTSLCHVTGEEGTVLMTYIWLEGTDAQALIGSSDSVGLADDDDSHITIRLSFTGALI